MRADWPETVLYLKSEPPWSYEWAPVRLAVRGTALQTSIDLMV